MNRELVEQALELLREAVEPTETREDVYGGRWWNMPPPVGYGYSRVTSNGGAEFRPPLDGEPYLLPGGKSVGAGPHRKPRFILRPDSPSPSVSSVYGKTLEDLTPPKGWVFTGEFRPILLGDPFMGKDGRRYITLPIWERGEHRLILRRAKRLVFDIIGENREPKEGEWAANGYDGDITGIWKHDGIYCVPRLVLSAPRVEEDR